MNQSGMIWVDLRTGSLTAGVSIWEMLSTASKAASLPENLNSSESEPSSSKAAAGSDLAISSIEKLDEIESFMAPLSEEVIEKADALLKA